LASSAAPLFVRRDQVSDDFFIAEIHGPSVGLGSELVQLIMMAPDDADEPAIMNIPLFLSQSPPFT
jgi:hypothetical protein